MPGAPIMALPMGPAIASMPAGPPELPPGPA
jgi:hypothetical protein